ncbi:MAG: NADH-quinone oxidoreductase subunit B, partial [Acidobacteriota bacterium]|nr:NADH-quinone oxidoreductase subunit B [Acidobacteriota bacterium]
AAIPVSAYIPGCAVRPEAIIDGVVKLLNNLKNPAAAPALPITINPSGEGIGLNG